MSAARKLRGMRTSASTSAESVSSQDQRLFQELLEEHCGVTHGLGSRAFLERKLMPRVEHLGLGSLQDYYRFLKYDPGAADELEVLVDRLTTHETYFFREEQQLEQLYDDIVPKWVRTGSTRPFRVWSAGCSTGEEVYSLAILLNEHPELRAREFEVVGTDISRDVIRCARQGVYTQASFRCTPAHLLKRYFQQEDELRWSVNPVIQSRCSFGQLNLMDADRFRVLGRFDVVFCRNVLIYFANERRPTVINGFYDALNRGGHLFLGHSESLLNLNTRFECVHLSDGIVYRKGKG